MWINFARNRLFLIHPRAPRKRPKTLVLAKMKKLHHLKQISELNAPVGFIFNGNAKL